MEEYQLQLFYYTDSMSNGFCYDRALLMARAFLDSDDDVKLVYASVNSIKLNPLYISDDEMYADHCILEMTTKDGKHLIYDTSTGFIYDKWLYWLKENPKVRFVNSKERIKEFLQNEEMFSCVDIEKDKFVAPMILPLLEKTYGRPNEMYSQLGISLLQREIEHYKQVINYDGVCEEINKLSLKLIKK